MTRLIIYLSFLSLSSAEELGLLNLTQIYIVLVLVYPFTQAILKRRVLSGISGYQKSFLYLWAILLFLPINFLISQANQVAQIVWVSRSIHLALIPFFYVSFKLSKINPEVILKDICIAGFIEAALIYISFFMYLDSGEIRRAADIEGVVIFSVFIVFAAFYSLKKYETNGPRLYLLAYILILLATILTGTRMLIVSVTFLTLMFRSKSNTLKGALVISFLVISLSASVFFDRFNLDETENVITIEAKIEEVEILTEYFLSNPFLGMGFGKPYQVALANSEYTYSHNIFMFYLGYGGLIGLLTALYPMIRLLRFSEYRVLMIAVFIFYTTSTTYTNVKHSILIAFVLVLLDHKQISVCRNSSASQMVPST